MPPHVVARYDYVDELGKELFQVERLVTEKGKGFRQRRPGREGEGEWVYRLDVVDPETHETIFETRRVLYRLPKVIEAIAAGQWIFLVEGEKDVHTIEAQGKVATTVPGGAGKWRPEYTETLRGAKVAIVPDNDGPGCSHALKAASALDGVAAKLLVYQPPESYKDVTEMFDGGADFSALRPFDWRARMPERPTTDDVEIRVMSMQELMATPDVAEHDKLVDHLLLKRSRLIIGAWTGEGKSSIALQILRTALTGGDFLGWRGIGNGTRALVLDVEQGRRTIKRRFVEMGLNEYPDQVKLVWVPDGLALDSDASHISKMEKILAQGWDIVIADPLYKLHRGDANDERKAVDLMRRFDDWRTRFEFALILPMHCRKPQTGTKFSIHDITGSSGYTRGAEVVVGLQRVKKGYAFLHWWKDREGDLDCINERWGLLFDQGRGFRRDPQDLDRKPLRERVKLILEVTPGMTLDDLREETEAKQSTIRRALDDVGAIHDGERLVGDRHWSLPPTLFADGSAV